MRRYDYSTLRRVDRESNESYRARLRRELPLFPVDVLDHWLIEHDNALQHVGWLDLRSLTFTKESWHTDRIISTVKHFNESGVEIERRKFTGRAAYRESYPLAVYFCENGTWPVPIVVYHNAATEPILQDGGRSEYVAIEGMHRLGFLRGLIEMDSTSVVPEHDLWIGRKISLTAATARIRNKESN